MLSTCISCTTLRYDFPRGTHLNLPVPGTCINSATCNFLFFLKFVLLFTTFRLTIATLSSCAHDATTSSHLFLRFFVSAYVFFEPAMFCKTWKPAVNAPVARQVDMQRTMEGFLNPNTKEALNPAKKGFTQSVRFRSRSEAHNVPLNTPINTLKAAVLPAT